MRFITSYTKDIFIILMLSFLLPITGCVDNAVQSGSEPGLESEPEIGSGSEPESESQSEFGNLKVLLTDAPFPATSVASVTVSISKVEARNKSEEDSVFTVLSGVTQTYDLLDLQNGVTADLANLPLPTGLYDQIRIFIDEASVTLIDDQMFPMTIPSGASSGLKLFISPPIKVQSQQNSELMLDFDVGRSFIVKGNPNTPAGIKGFNFKPVIRVINISDSGRITGTVRDNANNPLNGVTVSALQQNSVIATVFTNTTGQYTLMALPAGTYTLTAELQNFDTVQQDNISVTAGSTTTVDIQMNQ